nr:MAG TPA: hypothetical protein [Caudoviricetes sp.]
MVLKNFYFVSPGINFLYDNKKAFFIFRTLINIYKIYNKILKKYKKI